MTTSTSPITFVVGAFDGLEPDPATIDRLRRGMPGVSLFREANLRSAAQVKALTDGIHEAVGSLPALVAIDQEAGQLQALAGIVTDFPGNMAMTATGDLSLAERVGEAIGHELRALGVTVNYAPVCDLLTIATNHGLSIRSFGSDPDEAASFAAAIVDGLQRAGVAATGKHFPGKGAAEVDTHYGHAVINRTREEFDESELVPFRSVIKSDVKLMMTSHATVPALSGGALVPATRSADVLTGVLRDELGFHGVTITDALDMAGVGAGEHASNDESYEALQAGADLLLTTPFMDIDVLESGIGGSMEASSGRSSLADSGPRVRELREWLAGFTTPSSDAVGCEAHRDLSAEVARRSLTLREGHVRRAIGPRCVVIEPERVNLTKADTTNDNEASLVDELASGRVAPIHHGVSHAPTDGEIDAAVDALSGADDAVVVVTAAATEPGQVELVRRVIAAGVPATVVVARNPLDAEYLDLDPSTQVIFTYGFTESTVRALGAALITTRPLEGKLPIANRGA